MSSMIRRRRGIISAIWGSCLKGWLDTKSSQTGAPPQTLTHVPRKRVRSINRGADIASPQTSYLPVAERPQRTVQRPANDLALAELRKASPPVKVKQPAQRDFRFRVLDRALDRLLQAPRLVPHRREVDLRPLAYGDADLVAIGAASESRSG
jgi:hypothetical protein